MDSEGTKWSTMSSGNPFSDRFAEPTFFDDLDNSDKTHVTEIHNTTAFKQAAIAVPILEPLTCSTPWTPTTTVSTPSTTSPPLKDRLAAPIQWTDADLLYLLSILHPDLLLTNRLTFNPPLSALPSAPTPLQLQLFSTTPNDPVSRAAYSKHAPIGTGRPRPRVNLLAESTKDCTSAQHARRSLVYDLLSNYEHMTCMLDNYNVLSALYAASTCTLASLYRGMIEMLGTGEKEWSERRMQLGGQVDGECVLEARFEHFLLGVGREKVVEWVRTVRFGMDMGVEERRGWGEVYGDAARFLCRAVR